MGNLCIWNRIRIFSIRAVVLVTLLLLTAAAAACAGDTAEPTTGPRGWREPRQYSPS